MLINLFEVLSLYISSHAHASRVLTLIDDGTLLFFLNLSFQLHAQLPVVLITSPHAAARHAFELVSSRLVAFD